MYYINHSGIKGQKKGVRRYQYANKSYTPEGNRRYRPSKGDGGGAGTVAVAGTVGVGALAAAYIHSGALSGASTGAMSAALTAAIAAGKAAVAAVPAGVWALSIPMAIVATPLAIEKGAFYTKKILDRLDDTWWW